MEGGDFYAFEGCFGRGGCCPGNCSHVWNYAQTLAWFFPELERSMRRTEFLVETTEEGAQRFRAMRALEGQDFAVEPAADGQCGAILRVYREWLISGERDFLEALWPACRRALDYARRRWDEDGDGVFEGRQHNTYDIEFYGPNPMTGSVWIAALQAASRMAAALGEDEEAQRLEAEAARSAAALDALCWQGDWYVQRLDDVDRYPYQYGEGCLSDQLIGTTWAWLAGLEPLLPRAHVERAAASIFAENACGALRERTNLQRAYAFNDEPGLVLCSWPRGGRPRLPFVYSDEVWTGTEYQVASLLALCGRVEEAVALVEGARRRHDGLRRNPWDEVECGHHYARSLASFGVWIALAGMRLAEPGTAQQRLSFAPQLEPEGFRSFFICAEGWGLYTHEGRAFDWRYRVEGSGSSR